MSGTFTNFKKSTTWIVILALWRTLCPLCSLCAFALGALQMSLLLLLLTTVAHSIFIKFPFLTNSALGYNLNKETIVGGGDTLFHWEGLHRESVSGPKWPLLSMIQKTFAYYNGPMRISRSNNGIFHSTIFGRYKPCFFCQNNIKNDNFDFKACIP